MAINIKTGLFLGAIFTVSLLLAFYLNDKIQAKK